MKIQTSHDRPPIPTTAADWSAVDADTYDGAEDSGELASIIGRGPTELAAINDLMEQTVEYWRTRCAREDAEAIDALRELVARCDGAEGVRADGSNIQTMRAHAAIAAVEAAA